MERKVKYDYVFKVECLKFVLEEHCSFGFVSKQKGINESNIRKCVGFYKSLGKTVLLPRKNQSYSVGFKLKVLKSISKYFLSLSQTCLKFSIPGASIIIKWKIFFANFGVAGLKPKPKGRPKSMSIF